MKIKMEITGLKDLERALDRAPTIASEHARATLQATARAALHQAQTLVPVETGTLRKSLTLLSAIDSRSPGTLIAGVGIDDIVGDDGRRPVEYWLFVHYSPSGVPFFRMAGDAVADAFAQKMGEIGKKLQEDFDR